MGRWAPDARGRLMQAAMELYVEHGYDRTTTADIAERAGLTERTYFRHFADKREVLFDSTGELEALVVAAVVAAPADEAPLPAVAAGLHAGGLLLDSFGADARRRAAVVTSHPELRERELQKMAALARAVAGALGERGVAEPAATLAAETGVTVFRLAFDRWAGDPAGPDLPRVITELLAQLRAVATD
ncbi:TetR family transcriptional regulator [Geodermatophilus sp. Leaf369]|uniref:TetR/AcrR family transcriptional regulator n=1 Tax=Geodermatophilus sp. Leaf369 TaxID=1736354 RepID=UPI0006FFAFF1|nr:TetR/AcrR family transcriptional regulator [Geodermatophilus sp. Leaf369]KQS56965.1 TetR family transcriptional regulator [Geodermatophilus sp. Leaf369]QNG35529.1 TetR/AcrR family transcriptional regulator [Geodermatophilaceae bacterium NBWT11]